MNIKQLTGIIGAFVLIIAVFTPIVSVPLVGNLNYFQNGEGDGVFILILAIVSLFLIFTENYKGLWITGALSYMIMLFTFFNFRYEVAKLKNDVRGELGNNQFSEFAEMAIDSVQFEWGLALLIVGAALILYSAGVQGSNKYIFDTNGMVKNLTKLVSNDIDTNFVILQGKNQTIPPIKLIMNIDIIVGRSRNANIYLDNEYVSGQHLSLHLNQYQEVIVTDLNSSNGTYISGKKLLSNVSMILKRGEQLIIGSEEVVYTI